MESTSDNVFAAEKILKERKRKDKTEYLIKWKGWGTRWNSWEPTENILDQRLLEEYETRKENIASRKKGGKRKNASSNAGRPPKLPKTSESKSNGETSNSTLEVEEENEDEAQENNSEIKDIAPSTSPHGVDRESTEGDIITSPPVDDVIISPAADDVITSTHVEDVVTSPPFDAESPCAAQHDGFNLEDHQGISPQHSLEDKDPEDEESDVKEKEECEEDNHVESFGKVDLTGVCEDKIEEETSDIDGEADDSEEQANPVKDHQLSGDQPNPIEDLQQDAADLQGEITDPHNGDHGCPPAVNHVEITSA